MPATTRGMASTPKAATTEDKPAAAWPRALTEARGELVGLGPGTVSTLFWRWCDLAFMLMFVCVTLFGLFGESTELG
jgi:hypothetical protein